MTSLYETDFYAWANQQAKLLREGNLAAADIANIAEEIESMGRTEKRELVSRLTVLIGHLLKWTFQPEARSRSWETTIRTQRIDLQSHMHDNPSLKPQVPDAIAVAYKKARIEAATETDLAESVFPATCPWSFGELMDDAFWPK